MTLKTKEILKNFNLTVFNINISQKYGDNFDKLK